MSATSQNLNLKHDINKAEQKLTREMWEQDPILTFRKAFQLAQSCVIKCEDYPPHKNMPRPPNAYYYDGSQSNGKYGSYIRISIPCTQEELDDEDFISVYDIHRKALLEYDDVLWIDYCKMTGGSGLPASKWKKLGDRYKCSIDVSFYNIFQNNITLSTTADCSHTKYRESAKPILLFSDYLKRINSGILPTEPDAAVRALIYGTTTTVNTAANVASAATPMTTAAVIQDNNTCVSDWTDQELATWITKENSEYAQYSDKLIAAGIDGSKALDSKILAEIIINEIHRKDILEKLDEYNSKISKKVTLK